MGLLPLNHKAKCRLDDFAEKGDCLSVALSPGVASGQDTNTSTHGLSTRKAVQPAHAQATS